MCIVSKKYAKTTSTLDAHLYSPKGCVVKADPMELPSPLSPSLSLPSLFLNHILPKKETILPETAALRLPSGPYLKHKSYTEDT